MTERYVHAGGLGAPVAQYDGSGTSTRRWPITDERGSVVAQTDSSGALVSGSINTYDTYGMEGSGNTGTFGYAGQMRLPGIAHATLNRNRVYNADLARFMSTDPIGQAGGLNLYSYTGGDPVNFSDPLGLDRIVVVGRRTCNDECQAKRQRRLMLKQLIDMFGTPGGTMRPRGPLDGNRDQGRNGDKPCPIDPTNPGGGTYDPSLNGVNLGIATTPQELAVKLANLINDGGILANAFQASATTDREIGFDIRVSNGRAYIHSNVLGPAGSGAVTMALSSSTFLFLHTHGASGTGSMGLSPSDFGIYKDHGIPVAAIERDGTMRFYAGTQDNGTMKVGSTGVEAEERAANC